MSALAHGGLGQKEPALSSATQKGFATVRYVLDPSVSRFTVQAFATGILSAFGHNPTIAIRDYDGEVQFAPGTYENASVHVTAKTTTFEVLDEMKRSDREKLEQEMFSTVLDAARFPTVLYQSRQIVVQKDGGDLLKVSVTGDLTLHGVTQVHSFEARAVNMDPTVRIFGDFTLHQSDYGMKQFSVAGGVLRLKDELKFKFELIARRKE
jgi:polyisoprenoid-binding protein YceI